MLENIRIVMVKTMHPGNIGAAARAMKNMGLQRLYLVSPNDFPSFEASARAASATDVLQQAVVVNSLAEALQGCSLVAGTTARQRSVQWPQIDARECGDLLITESRQHEVALVFGCERTGLENDELEQCQYLVNIPTSVEYTSLNLAQAVQILCYEILMAQHGGEVSKFPGSRNRKDREATAEQLEGMYQHYLDTMIQLDFFGDRNPEYVIRQLRCLYGRARPTLREVQILRGVLTAAQGRKNRGESKS
ncbi:MAG: RNA methyltransferase [Gammaproteobacteria bacterium]|nr:MAG: RNA methyltransferase [Gammaproteobacteria bacterium]